MVLQTVTINAGSLQFFKPTDCQGRRLSLADATNEDVSTRRFNFAGAPAEYSFTGEYFVAVYVSCCKRLF